VQFEWDPEKANANETAHQVSFLEGSEVFDDDLSSTVPDPDHSASENRYLIFGCSRAGRHLVVSFTERGNHIRLISARTMTPRERKAYEQ
jgi:uncharacterized DUF497 family protein